MSVWDILSERVSSEPLSASVRTEVLHQMWQHAITDTSRQGDRVWVARHPLLSGTTLEQVLAWPESSVRLAAVTNPALTGEQRQGLLRTRTGLTLLRAALSSAEDEGVLADLFSELLSRWPKMAARTRASFVEPGAAAVRRMSWPLLEETAHPHSERAREMAKAVSAQLIYPALTRAVGKPTPVQSRRAGSWPSYREHPRFLHALLPRVPREDLAAALAQPEVPPALLWSVLALVPDLDWPVAQNAITRLLGAHAWIATLIRTDSAMRGLAPWAVRYPREILDLLHAHGVTGEVHRHTREDLLWEGLAELADACLLAPEHAPLSQLSLRFRRAYESTPGWTDIAAARAMAIRPEVRLDLRLKAWNCWLAADADGCRQAAQELGCAHLLVASEATNTYHSFRLIDALVEAESEREDLAARALEVLLQAMPSAVSPELIARAGRAGALMAPWPVMASTFVAGNRLYWGEDDRLDAVDAFLVMCVERLSGPEDWEVLARLADTWQGSAGELLDAVEALRDR